MATASALARAALARAALARAALARAAARVVFMSICLMTVRVGIEMLRVRVGIKVRVRAGIKDRVKVGIKDRVKVAPMSISTGSVRVSGCREFFVRAHTCKAQSSGMQIDRCHARHSRQACRLMHTHAQHSRQACGLIDVGARDLVESK